MSVQTATIANLTPAPEASCTTARPLESVTKSSVGDAALDIFTASVSQ